jgi:4-amino-4-deoxy-L-arabinose transferase-like glycosyltransferase
MIAVFNEREYRSMKFFTDFLTNKETSGKKDLSILLLVFGVAFFQFLGRVPLIDPDEGRYAEIPREMIERGDFITPMLNYVKFFDKPPLHYWLSALSMTLFGQNEFAARFTGAAMGLLTVLLVYHVGRRLFGRREGLLAALILGASTGFLVQARYDITDMTLTCTLSAALAFFILATREGESRKGLYYHLFYLFAALAVLAKGLIGIVFPCAIIFFYLLITRRWRLLKEMRLATGIPLFLLVCAPWFILVSIRNPEFARYFFIHEHFERFTTTVHNRKQGFWFYIPVLIGAMLPWSFFIPSAFRGVWRERLAANGNERLYLVIWAAFIFLFFSKSSSQLVPYILPVFPPLALLIGYAFARVSDVFARSLKIESYIIAGILTVFGAAIICYPHVALRPELSTIGCAIIGGIFFFEGIMTFRNIFRGSPILLFTGLLICSYIMGIAGPPYVLARVAEKKSAKELALIIKEKAGKDAVIATFGPQQGLTFYTRRRVVIIGNMAEFEFGSRQGDQSAWFPDLQRFAGVWNSATPVFAILPENTLPYMQGIMHISPRIIAQKGGKILITNH